MDSPKTLGQVLADARRRLGKSLKEIAQRVKKEDGKSITPQYLNDIEHNRRTPAPSVLEQLAKIFGFSPEYLYLLAGTMPEDLQQPRGVSESQAVAAFKAFRRKLGG